jgi:hypothetical protein
MELKRGCAIFAGETNKKVPPILHFFPAHPTYHHQIAASPPLSFPHPHASEIRGANTHHHLQDDPVEHLWILKENI